MLVELVLDAHATIGESPTWSPSDRMLYWIDIKAPALHRFNVATGSDHVWPLPSEVGAFALMADAPEALVALRHGLFALHLESGAVTQVAPPPFDPALHRFNEGACDGAGRFWVGTMFDPVQKDRNRAAEPASLYRYAPEEGLVLQPDAAELHNGMAWSPDGALFYLSHSNARAIYSFEFDVADGKLGLRRTFVQLPQGLGLPDGAAVDAQGGYWCAVHGSSRLHRYTAEGKLDREIMLPVSQPTMCCFAGPDLDELYVTSAADQLSPEQLKKEPHAGGLFRLRPGVHGVPRRNSLAK